jgi:putative transposase
VVLWGEHEEDTQVAKKGHTEEQILRATRQAEGGTRVADICREHGISEATFYIYGRLPRGKKALGPGLAVIDCKHLSGVTT